jgi:hypothetical protein
MSALPAFVDLNPHLPENWLTAIRRLADEQSLPVHLSGDHRDSREDAPSSGMTYWVVPGDVVESRLPWLLDLYKDLIPALVVEQQGLSPARERRSRLNINVLYGRGSRYEWHVDPTPYTAVLFVTQHSGSDGGALVLRREGDCVTKIQPRTGWMYLFPGNVEHAVEPLTSDSLRITVPMCYSSPGLPEAADDSLLDYLYSSEGDTIRPWLRSGR